MAKFFDGFGGAALGAVGSLAGNIVGSINSNKARKSAERQAQLNREFQSKEARESRSWAESMWNKNNAYNDPSQQMSRAKAAGLNADLLYGGGVGNTSQLASSAPGSPSGSMADTGNIIANRPTFGNVVSEAANTQMQYKLANAQADKIEAETDNIKKQAEGTSIQNEFLPKLLKSGLDKNDAEINKLLNDSDLSEAQREQVYANIRKMSAEIQQTLTSIRGIESEIENKTVTQAQNWFKLNLDKNLNRAQISKLESATGLDFQTIHKLKTLMPYEIQNLVSVSGLNDAEAGVHFLNQGLKSLEQVGQRLKNEQLSTLVTQAKQELERSSTVQKSYKSSDGSYSAVGKAVFLLQDMVSGSIGKLLPK